MTLLTPNWQTRLPGFEYTGDDPDGYMSMPEIAGFIEDYASRIDAPVITGAEVREVNTRESRFELQADNGGWQARAVVLASGACNLPSLPAVANDVPDGFYSIAAQDYRNPSGLPDGGVLVVGASASGLQLAEEIHASGRPVTLAVGEHVRMPRVYRGRDIQWWMDAAGVLDEGLGDIDDVNRARNLPSPQLVGSRARQILDLNALTAAGVRLVGRLMGIRGNVALFSGSLKNVCALADLKMGRLLDSIDEWAAGSDLCASYEPPERFERTRVEDAPPLSIDLATEKICTILWATGFRPDYSWLGFDALDRKGRLVHDEGVVSQPGVYVIGLPFMRKRKSSFIHGTEDDARHIVAHLAGYLGQ